MPLISDRLIEELKREIPITQLCKEYGIELKAQGKDLIGHCPFHDDKTPSFIVTPSKNLWNCLGACGKGGDNIELVMRKESVSFRKAVEKLQTMSGKLPEPAEITTRSGTKHPILISLKESEETATTSNPAEIFEQQLLWRVVEHYQQSLLNHADAMGYLRKRCCFHPEAITKLKLGYANRTLGYQIPSTTSEGKKLKATLQKLGVLRKSGHEHLSGSIVIPMFDREGRIVQLYGRKIHHNLRKGTPDHLYLPGVLRGTFNPLSLTSRELLLCESPLDALTFWSAGIRNVSTLFGTNTMSSELRETLKETPPERILLCFDNDPAGNLAVNRYAQELSELGSNIYRVPLPEGKDINDIARSHPNNPSGALLRLLEQAEPLGEKLGEKTTKREILPPSKPAPSSLAAPAAPRELTEPTEPKKTTPSIPPSQEEQPTSELHPDNDQVEYRFGDRHWRVRGLLKNNSLESMRIQLRILRGETYHLDTLELYSAKQRGSFLSQAVEETGLSGEILKLDLGKILLRLETLQEKQQAAQLETTTPRAAMSDQEREEALAYLRSPDLLEQLLLDYEQCGIIGETNNKLIGT